MFLELEGNDLVCVENVVALVRREGSTDILMRDGTTRETCFTPLTLNRRSGRFCVFQRRRDVKDERGNAVGRV